MNKRKCPHCKEYKKPDEWLLINNRAFCNYDHAAKYAISQAPKVKAKNIREAKKKFRQSDIKTRKAAARAACHKYIKLRDSNQASCICCDRQLKGAINAGHFIESGNNPVIRYHEDNIHSQLVYCNNYQGGDSGDYEKNLRAKIGDERVDWLISQKGKSIKRTVEDYKEIEEYYKNKIKELDQ